MKKVVSGRPVRAVDFTQAVAGLPDTTFCICAPFLRPKREWQSLGAFYIFGYIDYVI
jgi:hypothetical protein